MDMKKSEIGLLHLGLFGLFPQENKNVVHVWIISMLVHKYVEEVRVICDSLSVRMKVKWVRMYGVMIISYL